MRIDLDTLGVKMPLNVESVRRVYVQVESIGADATTAVLEVKRAFSDTSPSASFSTAQTIDLTGGSVLEICTTDTAWLHFVCTTAEASVVVNIETMSSGAMTGKTLQTTVSISADALGVRSEPIDARMAYKAFVLAEPHLANTAALEIKHSIDPAFNAVAFDVSADLVIDSASITSIETDNAAYLKPVCETSQAGQTITLWWYLRGEVMAEATKEFLYEAAAGRVPGYSVGRKFGRNPDIDTGSPEDIWNGGGLYTGFPTTGSAETVDVVSSSTNDAAAGTGARTINLFGLDENYIEQEETITMNGTTAVTSTKIWWRLNRVKVTSIGSLSTNDGSITVNHTTTTANVFAVMPASAGQTAIMAYTIPANKKMLAIAIGISIDRASGSSATASATLRICDAETGLIRVIDYFFPTEGSPIFKSYEVTEVIEEKTDIWIRVDSVGTNNTIVIADMQYLLVPK